MKQRRPLSRPDALLSLLLCAAIVLVTLPPASSAQPATQTADAPRPVSFPRDDGPHDTGVEWWYFTGHLFTADGARYGFEYVIFRARQGDLEGYAAHFAVTDNTRGQFRYAQRIRGASGVAGNAAPLDLDFDGWTMRGGDGAFSLAAAMPEYTLTIDLATTKPPALHDGDGYIAYGDGTASYYYSWTRLAVTGQLDAGNGEQPVTGEAWMDHQWGDFATYRDGGWDWFSMQLADGTDVMLYLLRDPSGAPLRVDGSIVAPSGELSVLTAGDFTVTAAGEWTSPHTGTTYPSGWTIDVPGHDLTMMVTPSLVDQELDTRPTTGVIYWEGETLVAARYRGQALNGLGYAELTGYAPYVPVVLATPIATPAP